MASTAVTTDLVSMVAAEMASGIETAVDCWMAEIENVLEDTRLTTLGRLNGVREVLEDYKHLTGKTHLERRIA